jgi:hypothetical protein
VWAVDTARALRIGVREGPAAYELFDVVGSTRLSDGRLVVANGGAGEIRYYDATGRHLRTSGGRGGGPGEFRRLRKIFRHTADSLLASDRSAERLSLFDPTGAFVRTVPVDSVGYPDLPLDAWLEGPFWIATGAVRVSAARVRRVLRRLSRPDGSPAFRLALPATDGTVWIGERLPVGDEPSRWLVLDSAGTLMADVALPPRFDLHEAGGDYVLGRWRDADDVNFVHRYPLVKSGMSGRGAGPPPGWLRAARPWSAEPVKPDAQAALHELLRNLVAAQEAWFADHNTYGADARALRLERPPDVAIAIISASRTGWIGAATHATTAVVCGMSVGGDTPIGWPEGGVVCGSGARGGP